MADTALPKNWTLPQGAFIELNAHRVEPDLNTGCLLWSGSQAKAGYGTLTLGGKSRLAHRCAYEDRHGVGSADGLVVRHKCDTPACINDRHLIGGTQQDNINDAWARDRMRPIRGEAHVRAAISEERVAEFRRRAAAGEALSDMARDCPEIGRNALEAAIIGRSWKHLPGATPITGRATPGRKRRVA